MANTDMKTGPGLGLSLAILVIGFVLATAGAVLAIRPVTEAQTSTPHAAPGSIEQNLDPGEYDIFGESLDFRELIDENAVLPDEFADATITVLDPAGQELAIGISDPAGATNRGFTFYSHVGSFEVVEEGLYTIDVQTSGPTTFVVGESAITAWRDAIPWMILAGIGTLLLLAGVVMLILGIIRRQRAAKNQVPESTTPGQFPPRTTPPAPPRPTPPPSTAQPSMAPPPPAPGQAPSTLE